MCHIPYWVNLLAQNAVCDGVTFFIGSTLWPKMPFVTCDTFLIGPTCWPKFFFVTVSHSLLGQLYGPNRDQKLFKNSNTVKKLLKNSKNRKRDSVTFLIGSTCWPLFFLKTALQR